MPRNTSRTAFKRYVTEIKRHYSVLNGRSKNRAYTIESGQGWYSMADISMIGWARNASVASIEILDYPHVQAWLDKSLKQPAVQKAVSYP